MHKKLFLTNTDTTIGFISKSKEALDIAKNRAPNKKYIQALPSLKSLNKRVPNKFKRVVRRANKTTFILNKNYSFRIIKDSKHNLLLNRLKSAYTSSANKSNEPYNYNYAKDKADIIIYPLIKKTKASTILKLGKIKLKRLR